MVTICPICGAAYMQQAAFRLRSVDMCNLHSDQINRCFCGMSKADLETLAIRMDEKLHQLIDDHWSGITMDELRQNIREMRKGDPLRVELIHRMDYLDRLKKRLQDIQKMQEAMEEYQEQKEKEAAESDTIGFSDVLGLFSRSGRK